MKYIREHLEEEYKIYILKKNQTILVACRVGEDIYALEAVSSFQNNLCYKKIMDSVCANQNTLNIISTAGKRYYESFMEAKLTEEEKKKEISKKEFPLSIKDLDTGKSINLIK